MSNFQPEATTGERDTGLFGKAEEPGKSTTPASKAGERAAAPRVGSAAAEYTPDSDGAATSLSKTTGGEREQNADDAFSRLKSIDEALREIRGYIETRAREEQHQQYSAFSVAAGAAQAVALGLLVWAFAELAFGKLYSEVLMKLAFALVIQTIALTAIVAGRTERRE